MSVSIPLSGVGMESPNSPTNSQSPAAATLVASASATPNKEKLSTCERVVAEVLSTERLYIKSLQSLQSQYLRPLQTSSLQSELGVKPIQIQTIFSNLDGIVGFHQILLEELDSSVAKATPTNQVDAVAQIFLKFCDFMKMYTSYINNYEKSLHALTLLGENKKWSKFLQETRSKSKDGMDLMSLLIMPIQRLPRYELLLKELRRQSTGTNTHLEAALVKIVEINSHVNDMKRVVDRVADLLLIQVKLAGSLPLDQERLFPSGQLYAPHRRLIRQGELKKRGAGLLASDKSRVHYLFNDLLLWVNSHGKLKHFVPLLHAEVIGCPPENDFIDVSLGFELQCNVVVHDGSGTLNVRPTEKLILFCQNHADREGWVKDIETAIIEAAGLASGSNGSHSVVPDRLRRMSDNKRDASIMKPAPRTEVTVAASATPTATAAPTTPTTPNSQAGHAKKASIGAAAGAGGDAGVSAPATPVSASNGHSKKPSTSSIKHIKSPSTSSSTLHVKSPSIAHSRTPSSSALSAHSRQSSAAASKSHSKNPSGSGNDAANTNAGMHSKKPSAASNLSPSPDRAPSPMPVPVPAPPPSEVAPAQSPSPAPAPPKPTTPQPQPVEDEDEEQPQPQTLDENSVDALAESVQNELVVEVAPAASAADIEVEPATATVSVAATATVTAPADSNPAESAWRAASDKMYRLSRFDISSLKMLKTPTPNVKSAMESVGSLLDAHSSITERSSGAASSSNKKKSIHHASDWTALQSLLVKPNFLTILKEFNEKRGPMSDKAAKKISALIADPSMSVEAVEKASSAAGTLWSWVLSYYRLKHAGAGAGDSVAVDSVPVTPRPARPSGISRPSTATTSASKTHLTPGATTPRPKTPSAIPTPKPTTPATTTPKPTITKAKVAVASPRPASAAPAAPAPSAPAPAGDIPPIEELTKCRTQYRDTWVNYYHESSKSYYQCSVVDTRWEPVQPATKLAKLKVAEAANAARLASSASASSLTPRPQTARPDHSRQSSVASTKATHSRKSSISSTAHSRQASVSSLHASNGSTVGSGSLTARASLLTPRPTAASTAAKPKSATATTTNTDKSTTATKTKAKPEAATAAKKP